MITARQQRIPEHMSPQKGEIRLFDNRLLERLSRISPLTVLAVYLPIIVFSVWKGLAEGTDLRVFAPLFLCGIFVWTLFEYVLHRFVFHYAPKSELQKYVVFLFHGVHHQYPNDKDRLVMPVALSLLITVVLFALFFQLLGALVWGYFAGFTSGYLVYDMTHYSIHHFKRPKTARLASLWKRHLDHHYRDTNKGYGVSSPLWDRVFDTLAK